MYTNPLGWAGTSPWYRLQFCASRLAFLPSGKAPSHLPYTDPDQGTCPAVLDPPPGVPYTGDRDRDCHLSVLRESPAHRWHLMGRRPGWGTQWLPLPLAVRRVRCVCPYPPPRPFTHPPAEHHSVCVWGGCTPASPTGNSWSSWGGDVTRTGRRVTEAHVGPGGAEAGLGRGRWEGGFVEETTLGLPSERPGHQVGRKQGPWGNWTQRVVSDGPTET